MGDTQNCTPKRGRAQGCKTHSKHFRVAFPRSGLRFFLEQNCSPATECTELSKPTDRRNFNHVCWANTRGYTPSFFMSAPPSDETPTLERSLGLPEKRPIVVSRSEHTTKNRAQKVMCVLCSITVPEKRLSVVFFIKC